MHPQGHVFVSHVLSLTAVFCDAFLLYELIFVVVSFLFQNQSDQSGVFMLSCRM